MSLLSRIRGVTVIAVLWGISWAVVGLLFGLSVWLLRDPEPILPTAMRFIRVQALFFGIWGSLSGAVFASLLILAERNSTLSTLSVTRMARWGALGGFILPIASYGFMGITRGFIIGPLVPTLISATMAGILGAGMAAGHLSLARRAPALPSGRSSIEGGTA
jgi:hypothetical protein